jgi:aspartyl-tRNA synthetase
MNKAQPRSSENLILMGQAPSDLDQRQLKELYLKIAKKEE